MANPCRLNAQQHLFIFGLGIWVLPRFQRLSPFDDLHRKHDRILRLPPFFAPPHAFEEGRNESLSHRPLWQRWWYRAAIERGSAARVEADLMRVHASSLNYRDLMVLKGGGRSAAVRRRRRGRSDRRRSHSGQNWRPDCRLLSSAMVWRTDQARLLD